MLGIRDYIQRRDPLPEADSRQRTGTAPWAKKSNTPDSPNGIALLVAVVIIGAVALIFALGAAMLNLGILDERTSSEDGGNVAALADGCAEEALLRTRRDASFALGAPVSFAFAGGTCLASATDLGSGQRRFTIIGTNGIATKRRQLIVGTGPGTVIISSWIEIAP